MYVIDGNLYVGTSASELLHFVRIPPDPADKNGKPMFISASRLAPAYSESAGGPHHGVEQILLLPRAGKACILCNSTVTFYSLPELTPIFESKQVRNCNWIGGVDLNEPITSDEAGREPEAVTMLMSLKKKIQVVRIGDSPIPIKVRLRVFCWHTVRLMFFISRILTLPPVAYPFDEIQSPA